MSKERMAEKTLKIREAIDLIFSHNEVVALWADEDKDHFCIVWEGMEKWSLSSSAHKATTSLWADEDKDHFCIVWEGMAWDMPEKYLDIDNWRIFGLIPESIDVADTINIHIKDGGDSE